MGIIIPMERIRKKMERKEHIEREKLIEHLKKDPLFDLVERYGITGVIESIPSADVQPVVRGKWVKARGSWCTPGGDPVWECSECGKGRHVYGIEHGSYGADVADGQWVACPNCGAVMEES